MGEQTNLLPSLDATMALIASRRSIMPKDLSGEPLQRAEVTCKMHVMMIMIMIMMANMTMLPCR